MDRDIGQGLADDHKLKMIGVSGIESTNAEN